MGNGTAEREREREREKENNARVGADLKDPTIVVVAAKFGCKNLAKKQTIQSVKRYRNESRKSWKREFFLKKASDSGCNSVQPEKKTR